MKPAVRMPYSRSVNNESHNVLVGLVCGDRAFGLFMNPFV